MSSAVTHAPHPNEVELYAMLSDPVRFCMMLDIISKGGKRIKFTPNYSQRKLYSRMTIGERGVTHVVVKSRQIGMTTFIEALFLNIIETKPYVRAMTLFDKQDNTDPAREVVTRMIASLPVGITVPDTDQNYYLPRSTIDNATTRKFDNGSSWYLATAGAKTAGRSRTIDLFHGSEVAYWSDPKSIASGALEAAEFALLRVLESTANGAQGWFYDIANRAIDGDRAYRLHFFPWWESPEYAAPIDPDFPVVPHGDELQLIEAHGLTLEQINWRRLKISAKGAVFFQEYPETVQSAFMMSGGGFFGDVSKFFGAPKDATHNPEYRYVGGIDWGQSADYTVLSIGCVDTGEMVYRYRVNRMEYDDMINEIVRLCAVWGVDNLIPERNSMSMQVSALRGAIEASGLPTHMQPFTTTNDSKRKGIMSLHSALHSGALRLIPDEVVRAEYLAFESKQTATGAYTYQAAGDGHDDCIIADMLMWRAMNAAPVGVY